jgi:hypothetical protein
MRVLDTPSSICKGFKAGKYMFAEVGDIKAAQVAIMTIYLFWVLVKAEYAGPLGTGCNSSRSFAPSSKFCSVTEVLLLGVDEAGEGCRFAALALGWANGSSVCTVPCRPASRTSVFSASSRLFADDITKVGCLYIHERQEKNEGILGKNTESTYILKKGHNGTEEFSMGRQGMLVAALFPYITTPSPWDIVIC